MNLAIYNFSLVPFLQLAIMAGKWIFISFTSMAIISCAILFFRPDFYNRLEAMLSGRKFGWNQLSFVWYEKEIYTFHNWIFGKRKIIAPIGIIFSLCALVIVIKYL